MESEDYSNERLNADIYANSDFDLLTFIRSYF